jgi:cation diffusion facilitator CzcD-associated flavoprotein CzcO
MLNTIVISAVWDEEKQLYHIVLEDTQNGIREHVTAHVVITATGLFPEPSIPKGIKGVETFSGPSWHSACWRHDIDLSGKRVGVIGNGCSGYVLKISRIDTTPN